MLECSNERILGPLVFRPGLATVLLYQGLERVNVINEPGPIGYEYHFGLTP
ncbi:MAG: hypothetical protein ACFCD0_12365 [Gemmataceae bacterium]